MNAQLRNICEVIAYLSDNSEGVFLAQLKEVFPGFDVANLATRLAGVGMVQITPGGMVLDPFAMRILEDLKAVSLMIGEGKYRGELPRTTFASCANIDQVITILMWLDVIDDGRSRSDRKRKQDFLEPVNSEDI